MNYNVWMNVALLAQSLRGFESQWGHFFFNLPNLSSLAMALVSARTLTEMSTRNLPGGKWRPV
jgi:hypothetical protein